MASSNLRWYHPKSNQTTRILHHKKKAIEIIKDDSEDDDCDKNIRDKENDGYDGNCNYYHYSPCLNQELNTQILEIRLILEDNKLDN